jgi:5-hydroxyisourate hydrolase
MQVSTQVLDAAHGRPACDVQVRLERADGTGWRLVGAGATDELGRIESWGPEAVDRGAYRLIVDAGRFFATLGLVSAQTEVTIAFTARDGCGDYHVPVLLAPFGYATYTGLRT